MRGLISPILYIQGYVHKNNFKSGFAILVA
jgi:hypothetical protein